MYNRILLASIIAGTTLLSACNENSSEQAATPASTNNLETVTQKASYSFGVDIANRLAAQGIDINADAFARGVVDVFNKTDLALNDAEMLSAKTDFQTQLREKLAADNQLASGKNIAEGAAFLAENAKKEGVITTESGLQYKVMTSGDGAQPKASDTVTTHYRGTLIDGREFDSSIARGTPASFPVKGVIKGWTEALQLMHVGDKWELYIPSDLAYGKNKRSELIEANSTLIFELELLAIK